jgi:hypothetical protein
MKHSFLQKCSTKRLVLSINLSGRFSSKTKRLRILTSRWILDELTIPQKQKHIFEARKSVKIVREHASTIFAHRMTDNDSRFFYQSDSSAMFAKYRMHDVTRVSWTIGSRIP